MKLIQINTVCNESTGKIMLGIQRYANEMGWDTLSIYGRRSAPSDVRTVKKGNIIEILLHAVLTTITDLHGLGSVIDTRQMIDILRYEQPDIIHLHNLHGYYLNYPILFRYLANEFRGKIVWTLHDCWPFTGHCAYYTLYGCTKWQEGCDQCPAQHKYPWSFGLDCSSYNYRLKKKCFTNVKNLTIVVPSQWLKRQVKRSFLKDYPVRVIPNGIDLYLFQRNLQTKNIRDKYGIPSQAFVILCVASHWDEGKGWPVLRNISEHLSGNMYLVVVGAGMPYLKFNRVIQIKRTEDISELVQLYSMADVFLNPSLQETFSMVTLEALACGLPVIGTDSSAVAELVTQGCGCILHNPDVNDYLETIRKIQEQIKNEDFCRSIPRMRAEQFSEQLQYERILSIYSEGGDLHNGRNDTGEWSERLPVPYLHSGKMSFKLDIRRGTGKAGSLGIRK